MLTFEVSKHNVFFSVFSHLFEKIAQTSITKKYISINLLDCMRPEILIYWLRSKFNTLLK